MIVYCVEVYVKEEHEEDFIKITTENHNETRKEAGNLRFDLSKSNQTPGLFFLYEVYKDEQAVLEHKATAHYEKWRDLVAPWMEKPRSGHKYTSIIQS